MNDFTKDELKTIFGHLPIHTPERENSEKYQNIYKKLQSMIDTYCENEWNDLQLATIHDIQCMLNDCHYIDIMIRHNGEDKRFEGDFLKQLMRLL